MPKPSIREPSAAGRFYPGVQTQLTPLIEQFLEEANTTPSPQTQGIIVPHAGLSFSGPTAAVAFRRAEARNPERIWLLGPSHFFHFSGIALPSFQLFRSPLGDSPVAPMVQELSRQKGFRMNDRVHEPEHSLEVELPFIQHLWGDAPIIPMLAGGGTAWSSILQIAEVLRAAWNGSGDLFVMSNDFLHYGRAYEYAPFPPGPHGENIRKTNEQGAGFIVGLDPEGFHRFAAETTFDGGVTIPLGMLSISPTRAEVLAHDLSGDMAGDYHTTVGYLAIAME